MTKDQSISCFISKSISTFPNISSSRVFEGVGEHMLVKHCDRPSFTFYGVPTGVSVVTVGEIVSPTYAAASSMPPHTKQNARNARDFFHSLMVSSFWLTPSNTRYVIFKVLSMPLFSSRARMVARLSCFFLPRTMAILSFRFQS